MGVLGLFFGIKLVWDFRRVNDWFIRFKTNGMFAVSCEFNLGINGLGL